MPQALLRLLRNRGTFTAMPTARKRELAAFFAHDRCAPMCYGLAAHSRLEALAFGNVQADVHAPCPKPAIRAATRCC